jgi:hypothetical protein
MYLPTTAYEALPYLYVAGGAGVTALLEGSVAVGSGAILILTGILVFMMRRRNRAALAEMERKEARSRRRSRRR